MSSKSNFFPLFSSEKPKKKKKKDEEEGSRDPPEAVQPPVKVSKSEFGGGSSDTTVLVSDRVRELEARMEKLDAYIRTANADIRMTIEEANT